MVLDQLQQGLANGELDKTILVWCMLFQKKGKNHILFWCAVLGSLRYTDEKLHGF
jgi:hypothetical protein